MKLNNPSVMLISVCVLIAFIYYILHYIGYFTSQRIQDIKDYVQEAKKFKGYTKLDDDIEVYD